MPKVPSRLYSSDCGLDRGGEIPACCWHLLAPAERLAVRPGAGRQGVRPDGPDGQPGDPGALAGPQDAAAGAGGEKVEQQADLPASPVRLLEARCKENGSTGSGGGEETT